MAKVDHKPSQNERILDYMNRFGSITALEAIRDLGVYRLASRISDLKSLGYPIVSTFVPVKNRFNEKTRIKQYSLRKEEDGNGTKNN